MGSRRVNIRFFMWHIIVEDNWKFKIKYNECHKGLKFGWFDIYDFKSFKKL
jgi:hypothetical protein